jgi:hypothetical protein
MCLRILGFWGKISIKLCNDATRKQPIPQIESPTEPTVGPVPVNWPKGMSDEDTFVIRKTHPYHTVSARCKVRKQWKGPTDFDWGFYLFPVRSALASMCTSRPHIPCSACKGRYRTYVTVNKRLEPLFYACLWSRCFGVVQG